MSEPADPPFFIARETPTGVRFVRPPGSRPGRTLGAPFLTSSLMAVAVLLAAGGTAGYVLATRWDDLPDWARIAGPLYLVQAALDVVAVGRFLLRMARFSVGDLEMEIAGDTLRSGRRWGSVWLDAPPVSVSGLQRVVIVRRPDEVLQGKPGTSWDLIAEPADGPPVRLLSAYDEPELVRGVARELHARLSAGPEAAHRLPPLTEEERAADWTPVPVPPLVPGGGWTWLAIHLAGSVGLWGVIRAAWAGDGPGLALRVAAVGTGILQGMILVAITGFIQAERQARRAARPAPGNPPSIW